jgi:hypothetical protein
MSKFNSFVLVLITIVSLSSCNMNDKSKILVGTWRVENVKFNKPIPPQMQTYIQSQIEFMKGNQRTTYNADGTFTDVQPQKTGKGQWDFSKDGKIIYSTDEMGKTIRYMIQELSKDKLTYSMVPSGPADTLTFYLVPFSAKDTLNRKPMPQMQRQSQQQQEAPSEQQPSAGDSAAGKAPAGK